MTEGQTKPIQGDGGLVGIASAFLVLSWLVVSLRVYVRGFMIRSFGWDDWLMLVTLLFFTLENTVLLALVWMDNHYEASDINLVSRLMQYIIVEIALYICVSIFLKLSLAVFFFRVVVERWQRWVIIVTATVYTVYTLAYLFVSVFQCGDPSHFLFRKQEDRCLSWSIIAPMNWLHGSLNAAGDWIFAILPIFMLVKSQLPRRTKISVCFILMLGALGSVASLVRLSFFRGLQSDNFFTQAVDISIASVIEPGLGIIAGSLVTFRPLLKLAREKTRSGASTSGDRRGDISPKNMTSMPKVDSPKPPGEFAPYGFSDDLEKLGSTYSPNFSTTTTITGGWSAGLTPTAMTESSSTLAPRESSKESRASLRLSEIRKPSFVFSPRNSYSYSRHSSQSSWRKGKRESWADLEEARKRWHERTQNSKGDVRVQPNLLLPDVEVDEPAESGPRAS